jgi:hypothetical protein
MLGSIPIVDSTEPITSSTGSEARFFNSIAILSIATPHRPCDSVRSDAAAESLKERGDFARRRRGLVGDFCM